MKNKLLKIFIVILCVFSIISVVNFATISSVRADSGWDSDYDSGGSDWGSDWDSDSDWGSSGGSFSFVSSIFSVITILIVLFIVLPLTIGRNSRNIKSTSQLPLKLNDKNIHDIDPELNIQEFNKLGYEIYKEIQDAWMNFDYDKLRKYTTDEIYNMYTMQLDALNVKGEKNIMKDFVLVNSYISNIYIQNGVETIDLILTTNFYDYVVDSNQRVVRGSDKFKLEITYKLTFVKIVGANDNNFCPNCGAKLEDKASTKCPYCNSVIVSDNYTWVMSKKQSIHQRRI